LTREELRTLVAEHFKGHGQEQLVYEVVRGSSLIEALRYAHEKDIDLIILGRHHSRRGDEGDTALLARRITRKSTCSVLVLPEEYELQARAIVVPVRDSDCSANALEVACGIAAVTGATVTALNVYAVHAGYSRTGRTLEEHKALLEAAAANECANLIKRTDTHDVKVECRCEPDLYGKPVPIILEALGDGLGRAIVIGARGRTGAAGVLLGAVTEQLILKSPSPVLAVKTKGECLGVLRALLVIAGEGS
jgi:nucleotide-binding universal stress UspA family protein